MSQDNAEFRARFEQDGIEFFLAMFVDMHGKACAKMVPATAFDQMMAGSAGFAGFAAGPMGQSPADPDMIAVPDLASYHTAPWQPGLGVLQCDIEVEGQRWPYSPRVILGRQLEKLAERGLVFNVGTEIEYFLVRRREGGGIDLADPTDRAAAPCYDAQALSRMFDHLSTVSRFVNHLGWANYANDHEDANGQFEQNFRYADALTAADRVIFFRYMVHMLAHQAGMVATFMPKPFGNLTGNGLHFHSSLWSSAGDELFADPADPRGLGMSRLGYQFIAGLLDHAEALVAITCPTVNSYKRMGVGAPKSGATWAPAYASYGGNNRTLMLRIPEPGRVENRACDGAANPYLAMTAILAAGLDGIDRELDPGNPRTENLYELSAEEVGRRRIRTMPPTLLHATDRLVADPVLREALGKTPHGDYVDYYAKTKRDEFMGWHARVSDWEVEQYLTLS